MVKDIVHSFYHKNMAEEIDRLLIDCRKMGVFISKKEATALIAERSRRGFMTKTEILDYIRKLKGVIK
jgi:hypothetical protein